MFEEILSTYGSMAAIFFGALVAWVGVGSHKLTAKKQAAIKMLLTLRTDRDFLNAQEKFRELASKKELWRVFAPKIDSDFHDKLLVQNYLNTLELICVAIKNKVVHERVCKDLIGDSLIKRWDDAEDSILKLRKNDRNRTYYSELESVANTWRENKWCIKESNVFSAVYR